MSCLKRAKTMLERMIQAKKKQIKYSTNEFKTS